MKMVENGQVLNSIYNAIDEVNSQIDDNMQLTKSPDTVLFGRASKLDSLGLVTLVVAIEQRIQEDFGVALTIADEKAFSQKNSPFKTVGTLADYITSLLKEK
jgi:D-alanine--poly(phosphoribitol) ligase subunit 2